MWRMLALQQSKSPKEVARAYVILIAMVILFGAAAYFTGRLYGTSANR